jgi:hypothetical protein
VFAIEGWSWSKSADAVWESIDDWVASAANDEVVSWYLRDRKSHHHACALRETSRSLTTYNGCVSGGVGVGSSVARLNASLFKQSLSLIWSSVCFLKEALM